ncbi:gliding motility-associated C-terminal domain-containing protein [Mucilaginibacter xinganensis]|uniref:Gliding motility-associated C-terminal domain-containing protein n=1 Tax=Mucilaginibacter xinganensis TaxID=1234841 RepID=A0A223NZU8_9SPHI|nr:gliding motility-associated C-terminal domain-containing protein [Mucilaginibacter xinganensis]ASU35356.1 hypothetical protein MuYL_3471 [Mucilaginibacter xinganensis]
MFKNLCVLFLLISFKALAQTPNIGFEDGTFRNWQCYTGKIDSLGSISLNPTAAIYNRHTIISKQPSVLLDPYGKFPVVCPNGSNYSVRLGNDAAGAQAERVSYTFTVPDRKYYSIVFNYAVVLENPEHQPFQQPKFTAQVYDVTDDVFLECPSFNFAASSSLPGFKLSTVPGAKGESIYYKDWSTATIDLSHYAGKVISLVFTTNDCTKIRHFGYAYLDIDENNGNSIAGNAYCAGQTFATLYAPNGFASYVWYNEDLSKQVGTGQSLRISPPPPDNTVYAVKIFPYPGLGCIDTMFTTVKRIDEGFRLKVADTVFGCPDEGVNLADPKVTAGSSPGTMLSFFKDSLGTSYLYDPESVKITGTYYIQGLNSEGCMNILPVHVVVGLPELTVVDPQPADFPTTVDLSKTFIHKAGLTYSYYADAGETKPVNEYYAVKYGAVYYIKATSSQGCSRTVAVNVVIHPPPPYSITAPNTFTPNNDGINDSFSIKLSGFVTFGNVKIFNRAGQVVFTGKHNTDFWNGTYNGQNLPPGVYYWLFEGVDDYRQLKIHRAESITLLR